MPDIQIRSIYEQYKSYTSKLLGWFGREPRAAGYPVEKFNVNKGGEPGPKPLSCTAMPTR